MTKEGNQIESGSKKDSHRAWFCPRCRSWFRPTFVPCAAPLWGWGRAGSPARRPAWRAARPPTPCTRRCSRPFRGRAVGIPCRPCRPNAINGSKRRRLRNRMSKSPRAGSMAVLFSYSFFLLSRSLPVRKKMPPSRWWAHSGLDFFSFFFFFFVLLPIFFFGFDMSHSGRIGFTWAMRLTSVRLILNGFHCVSLANHRRIVLPTLLSCHRTGKWMRSTLKRISTDLVILFKGTDKSTESDVGRRSVSRSGAENTHWSLNSKRIEVDGRRRIRRRRRRRGGLQLRCVGATLLGCGLLDVDAAGEAFIAAAVH